MSIYTPELTEQLKQLFESGLTPDQIAAQLSIPRRSVAAKLSHMGLYKKPGYVNKLGLPPIKKTEYVEKIADALGIPADLAESLEKANKNILKLLLERLSENK